MPNIIFSLSLFISCSLFLLHRSLDTIFPLLFGRQRFRSQGLSASVLYLSYHFQHSKDCSLEATLHWLPTLPKPHCMNFYTPQSSGALFFHNRHSYIYIVSFTYCYLSIYLLCYWRTIAHSPRCSIHGVCIYYSIIDTYSLFALSQSYHIALSSYFFQKSFHMYFPLRLTDLLTTMGDWKEGLAPWTIGGIALFPPMPQHLSERLPLFSLFSTAFYLPSAINFRLTYRSSLKKIHSVSQQTSTHLKIL